MGLLGVRASISNTFLTWGRKLGRSANLELEVELSEHSIEIGMVNPNGDDRAWDENMYKYGNVFPKGYANPIKPVVAENKQLEDPDTVKLQGSDESGTQAVSEDDDGDEDDGHVKLISSPRFGAFMRQKLIESLLNPREQWRLIMYAVIGVGVLQFLGIIATLWATGTF